MDDFKCDVESVSKLNGMTQQDVLNLVIGSARVKKDTWLKIFYILNRKGYFKNRCRKCFLRERCV